MTNYQSEYTGAEIDARLGLAGTALQPESGKGLYPDADKTKLEGIEDGAQRNEAGTVVDTDYVHTDNNFSDADKALLGTAVQPAAIADMETKIHAAATYQPKGTYIGEAPNDGKQYARKNEAWAEVESTSDYPDLTNKPKINNVELNGNKTSSDLGLVDTDTVQALSDRISAVESGKQDEIGDLQEIREGAAKGATSVQGAEIDGVSIVDENGVAKIPEMARGVLGVAKAVGGYGIDVTTQGTLFPVKATDTEIGAKTQRYTPIVPANLDKAIKEGLGNYNLGTDNVNAWSDAYKAHARQVLGAGAPITIQILEEGDN